MRVRQMLLAALLLFGVPVTAVLAVPATPARAAIVADAIFSSVCVGDRPVVHVTVKYADSQDRIFRLRVAGFSATVKAPATGPPNVGVANLPWGAVQLKSTALTSGAHVAIVDMVDSTGGSGGQEVERERMTLPTCTKARTEALPSITPSGGAPTGDGSSLPPAYLPLGAAGGVLLVGGVWVGLARARRRRRGGRAA